MMFIDHTVRIQNTIRGIEKDQSTTLIKSEEIVDIMQTYFDRCKQDLSECKPGDQDSICQALFMLHQISGLFSIQTEIARNMRTEIADVCKDVWASVPSDIAFHFFFDQLYHSKMGPG